MKTAILTNTMTGVSVSVHATTEHPASSYGLAVWVDDDNNAYTEVDSRLTNPIYHISNVQSVHSDNIETRIANSGMTKTAIAKAMGISLPSLIDIIRNGNPTIGTLRRLADVLGCEVMDLMD